MAGAEQATRARRRADTSEKVSPNLTAFRSDVQGLRALAVVAVIAAHVTGWPSGGFVGVDVFFVISGFLITGLLLREQETTGRISLGAFYGRRARRILPAAITVLAVTVAIAFFLFNRPRALTTVVDALYSLVFVANWHFADVGTDYFASGDAVSPVQHYWSLAVEEQFYLVWPCLVLVLLLVTRRIPPAARRAGVAVVALVIIAASFLWAVSESQSAPTVAYFSTLTRAWEPAAGALLAAAAPALARLPAALRVLFSWGGLAGVVASFFVIDGSVLFPGPWAAMPVAATALVLIGGLAGTGRWLFPIANPIGVWLGNISFSLYLWHFPVVIFLLVLIPQQSTILTAITFGLILVLSVISYYLVEQPFHRSPWLRSFPGRSERRTAWRDWRTRFSTQTLVSAFALVLVAAGIGITFEIQSRDAPPVAVAPAAPAAGEDPEAVLQGELAAAVSAAAWPGDLSPSMDDAISTTSANNPAKDCFEIGATPDFDRCTWGSADAPNHMYLVGDSEALSYAPAFKAIAEGSGGQWRITTIGLYGCRFTDVLVANDGAGVMDACPQRKQDVAAHIAADDPRLVVVANAYALGQTPARVPLSTADIVASTAAETAKYDVAGRLLYLAPPPLGAELGQCYSPVSSPQQCNSPVGQAWQDFAAATQASLAGDFFVSSLPYSCYEGVCPAFAGTTPTKYDTVHMTVAWSTRVAPAIQYALVSLGLM